MARVAIICVTNIGVLTFSIYLGFNSGIFFYLFAAPHLIYLLFSIKKTTTVYACMGSYALTFVLAYIADQLHITQSSPLTEKTLHVIYGLNFLFSITFSFVLISIFAKNNDNHIDLLIESNKTLQEHEAHLQTEISEKNKLNKELSKTIKEKEVLLSEIHHRVKNNLAVISGLIDLQNFYVKDEKASAILKESRNRIKSIALLHEKFYENNSLDKIEIRSYVDELIYFIQLSFSNQKKEIKIHTQIENIELSMANALPFSLLLNELFTNSYKHAFKDKSNGNIYITLIKHQDTLIFKFKDDGAGFNKSELDKENSLGMNLIEAFTKQLKAQSTSESNKDMGMEFRLEFKYNLKEEKNIG